MKKLFFTALIVLGLGWYGIHRLFDFSSETRAYPASLIALDTATVTAIILHQEQELSFRREATGWIVSNGRLHLKALPSKVAELLEALQRIQAEHLLEPSPAPEVDFGLDENSGISIRVYTSRGLAEAFTLGRFHYDEEMRRNITYLRLAGQLEIYAVDGLQTLPLRAKFEDFRRRDLLRLPAVRFDSLTYQRGDTAYRFQRSGDRWQKSDGQLLDSAAAAAFFQRLRRLQGAAFADDFDELMAQELPQRSLTLYDESLPAPLVVYSYRDSSRQPPFVLRSSQYPESFFASDSSGLYHDVFAAPEAWRTPVGK